MATTKTPFQKFIQTKRDRNKTSEKGKSFFENKQNNVNIKKLNLGLDLCN